MPEMTEKELDDDLALLRAAAVSAGIVAMGYFRRDVKTWVKGNSSPVSEADVFVDKLLNSTLTGARPEYGWLSEELDDDLDRLQRDRVFIVDPIDGTRGFLNGDDAWTICLSVVENGVAKVGVVYAPARDELFSARKGGGAFLNGEPIQLRQHPSELPILPAPGAVHRELEEMGIAHIKGPYLPSLAHRLVQVATGRFDVAVARRGAQDWDISAATIILAESGVTLEDVCTGKPVFNRDDVRHGALAAMRDSSLKAQIHLALRNIYGCPEAQGAEEKQG